MLALWILAAARRRKIGTDREWFTFLTLYRQFARHGTSGSGPDSGGNILRKLLYAIVALAILVTVGIWQRHRILFPLFTTGETIAPLTEANLPDGGEPFGESGYFVVVQLDDQTFAIAEPYSWARNVNYLILGTDRALLFDAGVGHYDIRPVVKYLTDLPMTFLPSHLHYDHTGQASFDRIAIVDLPHLRKQAEGNSITFNWGQHLGAAEGLELPTWEISEWIKPGDEIDLGNRKLTLIYTPGHTDNSVSLHDEASKTMFTGDYYSANSMSAYYPTASMGDYLQTAKKILKRTAPQPDTVLHGAHSSDSGKIPARSRDDVQTLHDALVKIQSGELDGEGPYPVIYAIDEGVVMQAEPGWLQNWDTSYPDPVE